MGYFPFFVEIKGKKGLVVGGGKVAAHKIEELLPFEPALTVVAPCVDAALKEHPRLDCRERSFDDSDLDGQGFVVAATDDEELNGHISRLCREKGIPVNVADDREKCSFLFPALIKSGSLSAGICTGGASPQIAATLRGQLAAELPNRMDEILDYLAEQRIAAKERIPDKSRRTAFLKEIARLCMTYDRPLTAEETEARLTAYGDRNIKMQGHVAIVGAGCGSYDLITVRGLNAVRKAQVLIYDDLLDPRLLEFASESCEKIYAGKRMGAHGLEQEQINELLVRKAKEGKYVVRLKGGDPFVFGRGGEEILALQREQIECSEIPGITSAVAVPAAAGIPVTERGIGRSFHVVTGHTADAKCGIPENLQAIAALEGTCIFLMCFHHLDTIAEKLMEYGKKKETPAAVIHGGFDGTTDAVRGTLEDIAAKAKAAGIKTPAVIVIGDVASMELLPQDYSKK